MEPLLYVRIADSIIGFGVLFIVIGLGSNAWATYPAAVFGLWQYCTSTVCIGFTDVPGWMETVRAIVIISFLCGVVALVITTLWLFTVSITENKIVRLLAMIAAFASAGLGLLAIIIYGNKYESVFYQSDLGWSFVLVIVGSIVTGIGGGILFIPMKAAPNPQ